MNDVDTTLAHYGVPGMRWGKRMSRSKAPKVATPVEVALAPGKRVKARGGEYQAPHEDAVNAAAARQKARKSTVDALSTPELKQLVERLQLETNYAKLAVDPPTKMQKGKKYASKFLADEGKQLVNGKRGPGAQLVEKILASKSVQTKLKK